MDVGCGCADDGVWCDVVLCAAVCMRVCRFGAWDGDM